MEIGEAISILTEHLKDKGTQQVEVVDEPLRGTAWGEKIFRFTKTHDTKGKGEELFCPRFKLRDVGQSLAQLAIDLEANRKIKAFLSSLQLAIQQHVSDALPRHSP